MTEAIATPRADLLSVITHQVTEHPRSKQAVIGPSEIGTPCMRKLSYKLAQHRGQGGRFVNWRATVGTAVHTWLETAFGQANQILGRERWLLETAVMVGEIDGMEVWGHSDLYDLDTDTVIDWKIAGPSPMKARRNGGGIGPTYETQAHLYGRGYSYLGLPVKHVMIASLPAAGELSDAGIWTRPYDESIAVDALQRADGLSALSKSIGLGVLINSLPMTDDYCRSCEFRVSGSSDLATGCPGIVPKPDMMTDLTGG